ncbi:Kelch domain-containing protein 4 [Phytophthora cinnamomi]|uniref:Kelch domain-containing protein 4 n=1 Tax=Phytophthora cinnamomi TaxID=4785 RepID=UPI00355A9146|nr:Kelch domain-containing protein 4 [Phytophthora cinnamomi]
MTSDEILLLCALLEDTGCSDAMVLMVAALYRPPVERPVVPNIRFCITATTDVDAEFDFRFDVAGILQLSSLFDLPGEPQATLPRLARASSVRFAFCILAPV